MKVPAKIFAILYSASLPSLYRPMCTFRVPGWSVCTSGLVETSKATMRAEKAKLLTPGQTSVSIAFAILVPDTGVIQLNARWHRTLRRVSSSSTFFYKYVFAPVWIIGMGSGVISVLQNPNVDPAYLKDVFPIFWIVLSAFCLTVFRYAVVDVSDEHLTITRLWKTQDVPWTSVSHIRESTFMEPSTVVVHFNSPTQFGRSVSFLPDDPLFSMGKSRPVLEELQRMLEEARGAG